MKKLIMTMLIVTILLSIPNLVLARTTVLDGLGDLDEYKGDSVGSGVLKDKVEIILGWITAVGSVLAVAILIVIGIKYLFGSIEERADYKKTLVPYVIGAAILFSGSILPQLIYDLVN